MARRKVPSRPKRTQERTRSKREQRKSKRLGYSLTYSRQKRERAASKQYVQTAKKLAKFVPSLKPIARKSRLSPSEKAKVTHYAKVLRHATNLQPVTKREAKKFKKQLYAPGVQAIQLDDVSEHAKVTVAGDDLIIRQNGRTWVYWKLDTKTVRSKSGMGRAGERAFNKQFPIERVAELAEKAFKQYNVLQIHLWAHSGRVGQGFADLRSFLSWVNEKWQAGRYITIRESVTGRTYLDPSDPGKWVNGLAILIETPSETRTRVIRETKRANPMG